MAAATQYVDGRIPGQRIATTIETSDSSTFTGTETQLTSITFAAVNSRTYSVEFYGRIASTVDNDDVRVRLREDTSSGAGLGDCAQELTLDDQETHGQPFYLYTEYTADATENKTIVLTADRLSGTGDCRLKASASVQRAFLFVNYVSG